MQGELEEGFLIGKRIGVFTNWEADKHQIGLNTGDYCGFLSKKLSDTSDTSDSRGFGFVVRWTR
jgi:hypothetical protein